MSLPTQSTGVLLTKGDKPVIASLPLPALDGSKALVKIIAAPINPSDVMWLAGAYPAGKIDPAFSGLEGVGTVVATGPDADASLTGKRVCLFVGGPTNQGTWSDYVVVESANLCPLPDAIDNDQAACALVNPLTVELFLHVCETEGHTCIVHGAATSALGLMLIAAAKKGGKVTIINLVRRAENVTYIKSKGAEYAVDITADGWEAEFSQLVATLKPSAFFDPIGGSVGSKILSLMTNGSTTYNYGGLGDSLNYTVPLPEVLFKGKVLRGLWLSAELGKPGLAPKLFGNMIANLSAKTYQTTIYKKYSVAQFEEALKDYEANATKGKVLLIQE